MTRADVDAVPDTARLVVVAFVVEAFAKYPVPLAEILVVEAFPKSWSALQVFELASSVDDAAKIVLVSPRLKVVPLTVIDEFKSLLFAIEPASMVLVTVPVSVVYTPFVTVPAFPEIEPVMVCEKVFAPENVLLLARSVVEAPVKVETDFQ